MRKTIFSLVLLLLVALIPRLYQLTSHPPLIIDEPAYIRDINHMIKKNNYNPALFQWDFSQARLAYFPTIALMKLGFDPLFSLRFVSVLFSLGAIVAFYFILRCYISAYHSLLVSLLFSSSYYFIQFSRVGWGVIYSITLGLVLMLLVIHLTKKYSLWQAIVGGIVAGILLYTYRAGEVFIGAACLQLGVNIFTKTKQRMNSIIVLTIFVIVTIGVSSFWLVTIFKDMDSFLFRSHVVSVTEVKLPYHEKKTLTEVFVYQGITVFKSWILLLPVDGGGKENSRYLPLYYPPINIVLIPLFFSGAYIMLKNFKSMYVWIFIFLVGLFWGQFMTIHPPNGARGLLLLPVIYLCIGLSLKAIQHQFKEFRYTNTILGIIISCIAVSDIVFYYYWMSWIKIIV